MPLSTPFGRTTWKVDTALIWGGALSAVAGVLGKLQGLGVGFAFLLALAAFPLAFLTCILARYHREIRRHVVNFFVLHSASAAAESGKIDAATEMEEEREASTHLMLFFLDHISPAVRAHKDLQEAMVRQLVSQEGLIQDLAVAGIRARPDVSIFWEHFARLDVAYTSSPQVYVSLQDTVYSIEIIEANYHTLVEQADAIFAIGDIDVRPLLSLMDKWLAEHDRLVDEYDAKIKRDRRFGALFRPGRDSRWGVFSREQLINPNQATSHRP